MTVLVGQRIRCIDMVNDNEFCGKVIGPSHTSHYDYPVWDVKVDTLNEMSVTDGPVWSATPKEIMEVLSD